MKDFSLSLRGLLSNDDKTILIEIPAYRDKQLLKTMDSALIQADHPDRIHFAVCYQDDDMEDYNKLLEYKNCKVSYMKLADAKGLCYARYVCQKMLDDEDFVLHIDSHMRFVKHWDTQLIKQWYLLNDPKGVISTYLNNYNVPDLFEKAVNDPVYDKPRNGHVEVTLRYRFLDNNADWLVFVGRQFTKADGVYVRQPYMSGHFVFAASDLDRTVLSDPYSYFFADELSVAVRYYTHGYNVYAFRNEYVYHSYGRSDRKMPSSNTVNEIQKSEYKRLRTLLNLCRPSEREDLGEFGLGSVRTLEEFEKFAGIDFKRGIIYNKSRQGRYGDEDADKVINNKAFADKYEFINSDLAVILFSYNDSAAALKNIVLHCKANAFSYDRIRFIIGVLDDQAYYDACKVSGLDTKVIKLTGNSYSNDFRQLIYFTHRYYPDCKNVIVSDTGIRFMKDWDFHLMQSFYDVGTNNVLTTNSMLYDTFPKGKYFYYVNRVKYMEKFDFKQPRYKYINISKISESSAETMFFDNHFMMCDINTFTDIPLVDGLSCKDFDLVYPMCLYTHGRRIYVPYTSACYRVKKHFDVMDHFDNGENRAVVEYMLRVHDVSDSQDFSNMFSYDKYIGTIGTVKQWHSDIMVPFYLTKE